MNIAQDTINNKREVDSLRKVLTTPVNLSGSAVILQKPASSDEEIKQEVDIILNYNKSKLSGLKNDLKNGSWAKKNILKAWFKLLGIPEKSIDEADRICADKKFSEALKEFACKKQVSGMKEFLANEANQEEAIKLLKEYTENNNYPNLRTLLDRKIVQKEIKSYLKEASESYKKG